jgi:hypothetical protein
VALSIDEVTGDIHGTPTEPVSACRVTVTAFNGSGECVATVEMSVTAAEMSVTENGGRNCDRAELSAKLQAAATVNNQYVELQTATGVTSKTGDKYLQARLLEYCPAQASTRWATLTRHCFSADIRRG